MTPSSTSEGQLQQSPTVSHTRCTPRGDGPKDPDDGVFHLGPPGRVKFPRSVKLLDGLEGAFVQALGVVEKGIQSGYGHSP